MVDQLRCEHWPVSEICHQLRLPVSDFDMLDAHPQGFLSAGKYLAEAIGGKEKVMQVCDLESERVA